MRTERATAAAVRSQRAAAALVLVVAASVLQAQAQTPAPAPAAGSPGGKTAIRVAYVPVVTWLPAWVAKDRGMFEQHGLDASLTPIQNLSLLPPTVGRQFEFAASTAPDLIKSASSGVDVVAVAGEVIEEQSNQTMQVMVRPDSGIRGPADLKGKVIATPTLGAVMHLATLHWLKKAGVELSSIRGVEVPFPNMGDQLKAGRVDAIELLQPFVGQLKASGSVAIGDPLLSVADPVLFTFWISQGTWARGHPAEVKAFVAALTEARAFIQHDSAEARVILAKYTHLPAPVADKIPLPSYEFGISAPQIKIWVDTLQSLGQSGKTADAAKMVLAP